MNRAAHRIPTPGIYIITKSVFCAVHYLSGISPAFWSLVNTKLMFVQADPQQTLWSSDNWVITCLWLGSFSPVCFTLHLTKPNLICHFPKYPPHTRTSFYISLQSALALNNPSECSENTPL